MSNNSICNLLTTYDAFRGGMKQRPKDNLRANIMNVGKCMYVCMYLMIVLDDVTCYIFF